MKKFFFSVLAIAAIAACTKSEVQYETPGEIGFAPAVKNITKAAMEEGTLSTDVKLGIWAYWNYDSASGTVTGDTYGAEYLNNATFASRTTTTWGGYDATNNTTIAYPWPTNGSLVFAGYTLPTAGELSNVKYNGPVNNQLSFTYAQDVTTAEPKNTLNAFDLCWFGKTAAYNRNSENVPVQLSHALSWITIKAYGDNTVVGQKRKITSIVFKSVSTSGSATCVGSGANKATWKDLANTVNLTTYSGSYTIANAAGNAIETTPNGVVLIPQTPVSIDVTFEYKVGTKDVSETVSVNLKLTDTKDAEGDVNTEIAEWESGKHYTYTLYFKGNEILIAPSYGDWDPVNQSVTVE